MKIYLEPQVFTVDNFLGEMHKRLQYYQEHQPKTVLDFIERIVCFISEKEVGLYSTANHHEDKWTTLTFRFDKEDKTKLENLVNVAKIYWLDKNTLDDYFFRMDGILYNVKFFVLDNDKIVFRIDCLLDIDEFLSRFPVMNYLLMNEEQKKEFIEFDRKPHWQKHQEGFVWYLKNRVLDRMSYVLCVQRNYRGYDLHKLLNTTSEEETLENVIKILGDDDYIEDVVITKQDSMTLVSFTFCFENDENYHKFLNKLEIVKSGLNPKKHEYLFMDKVPELPYEKKRDFKRGLQIIFSKSFDFWKFKDIF